jgi:outer membrane autotransporter protein
MAGMGVGQGGTGGNGGTGGPGAPGTAGTGGGTGGNYNAVPGGATGGGGAGANSGPFGSGLGGGGGGGSGMVYSGSQNITVTSTGSVSGGNGGPGGVSGPGGSNNAGSSGGGGDGITLTASDNSVITVAAGATVKGGNGAGTFRGVGQGGNGIALQGNAGTIIVSGTVAAGGGEISGDAIVLTGDSNRIELRAGGVITGHVIAVGAGNELTLGGDGDDSFDASTLGTQFEGLDLHKAGASTWTLTDDGSAFTGTTTVTGGKLVVNGSLAGAIDITSGGRLGGTGTLGSVGSTVTVAAGGVHGPGNSIGVQTIAGNYVNHGTLQIEAEPTGADKLVVAGTVDISGATLDLLLSPNTAASWNIFNGPFTIIDKQSAGAVTGMFGSVTQNLLFLDASLDYAGGDGNDVTLELQRNDIAFADVGTTPNQIATGGAIDSLDNSNAVWQAIALAGDEDIVRKGFNALSGEIHASLKSALIEDSRFVRDAMNDRLRSAFDNAGASYIPVLSYAAGETPLLVEPDHSGPTLWVDGFGAWGSIDGDGNAEGLERSTGGMLIGLDAPVGDWRIGLLAGYGRSAFSTASSSNYQFGVYGGTEWGDLAVRGGFAYARHDIDTSRTVAIPGLTETLTANYGASTLQGFGELAYGIDVGATRISPFANLAYVSLSTDGFTEAGGDAALSGEAGTTATTFTTLGLRVEHGFTLGAIDGTLSGMLGWRHAFGDTTPESTHAFAGSDSFLIAGVPIAPDAAVIEAGLDLNLAPGATIGVAYAGQLAADARDHAIKASLDVAF